MADMALDSSSYPFSNMKRGIALLINNEYFSRSSGYKHRSGDERDHRNMKKIFKTLGFTVYPYKDKSKDKIVKIAQAVARDEIHQEADCFVCVVASHGEEIQLNSSVHGAELTREHNIVDCYGEKLRTSELIEIFDECEYLKGKPKIFFIQACRVRKYRSTNEGMDKGTAIKVTSSGTDGNSTKSTKQKGKQNVDSASNENPSDVSQSDESLDEYSDNDNDLDVSDTDDDEDFISFSRKYSDLNIAEDLGSHNHVIVNPQFQEVDSKGKTEEGKPWVQENLTEEEAGSALDSKGKTEDGKPWFQEEDKKSQPDSVKPKPKPRKKKPIKPSAIVPMVTTVPCPEDTLIMFASLSGNLAVRSTSSGSWLLNQLHTTLKQYSKDLDKLEKTHFLDILTEVLLTMSSERYNPSEKSSTFHLAGHFSPGCITHCLTKDIYFTRKESKRKKLLDFIFKRN